MTKVNIENLDQDSADRARLGNYQLNKKLTKQNSTTNSKKYLRKLA